MKSNNLEKDNFFKFLIKVRNFREHVSFLMFLTNQYTRMEFFSEVILKLISISAVKIVKGETPTLMRNAIILHKLFSLLPRLKIRFFYIS